MIAADTNVLLRLYVEDSPRQRRAALDLLSGAGFGGVYVNVVVLAEIAWALKSIFKLSRNSLIGVFLDLLTREELTIENRPAVMLAVRYFDIKRISFGDCLIAALNEAAGADTTYTFDQQAAGLRTFTLVGEEKEEP